MTKNESLQLFRYFQQEFLKLNTRFDTVDQKFDQVYTILDGMKGAVDSITIENTALVSQTTRHETWIRGTSATLNLPYKGHS
mgnify:CR=1 FL=1